MPKRLETSGLRGGGVKDCFLSINEMDYTQVSVKILFIDRLPTSKCLLIKSGSYGSSIIKVDKWVIKGEASNKR